MKASFLADVRLNSHLGIPLRRIGRKKSIQIRHLDLRQTLGVHGVALLDDAVLKEQISGHSVNFVRAARSVRGMARTAPQKFSRLLAEHVLRVFLILRADGFHDVFLRIEIIGSFYDPGLFQCA